MKKTAEEIRARILDVVTKNGGHLASSLGAVEIALALHAVFDAERDRIVWDVGHQAYAWKILTGRDARFETLRQLDGIAPFPNPAESAADAAVAGHAGSALSVALGFAAARDRAGTGEQVVAVIGDASIANGHSFEALNNCAAATEKVIVVLNDNDMAISKPTGSFSRFLGRLITGVRYNRVKAAAEAAGHRLRLTFLRDIYHGLESRVKGLFLGSRYFEQFGLRYIGPVDGHDLAALKAAFTVAKEDKRSVLVHVVTKKGKGYAPAERNPTLYHGVSPKSGDLSRAATATPSSASAKILSRAATATPSSTSAKILFRAATATPSSASAESLSRAATATPSSASAKILSRAATATSPKQDWSAAFGELLSRAARDDARIVALTAGMKDGTGLAPFAQEFPRRFFDVGIAEGHMVAFAAGLSAAGLRPVVCVYSTFLQRAVDQVIHDVAISNLPVVFCIDRAGLVGADGVTHQGVFDIALLKAVPNLTIVQPCDGAELKRLLEAALQRRGPTVIRYPRGMCPAPLNVAADGLAVEVANPAAPVQLWTTGDELPKALALAARTGVGVVYARSLKPFDAALLARQRAAGRRIVSLENGCVCGGFGESIGADLRFGWPDAFIPHGAVADLERRYGLDVESLAARLRDARQKGVAMPSPPG